MRKGIILLVLVLFFSIGVDIVTYASETSAMPTAKVGEVAVEKERDGEINLHILFGVILALVVIFLAIGIITGDWQLAWLVVDLLLRIISLGRYPGSSKSSSSSSSRSGGGSTRGGGSGRGR